jgi:osmotically-inducible protein OsmY
MNRRFPLIAASIVAGALVIPITTGSLFAQNAGDNSAAVNPSAENSAQNKVDANHQTLTPIDQSNSPGDIQITRQIRRALMDDSQLSMLAKNVKIITINGAVTLRGPVKTEQEKSDIAAKAESIAGNANVQNQLQVAGD